MKLNPEKTYTALDLTLDGLQNCKGIFILSCESDFCSDRIYQNLCIEICKLWLQQQLFEGLNSKLWLQQQLFEGLNNKSMVCSVNIQLVEQFVSRNSPIILVISWYTTLST